MPDLALTRLDDLTVLEFRGPDALRFLNGQLSHDTQLLPQRGTLLAGLHNPQGRVLALLRLFHLAPDHALAVVPSALAGEVQALLGRFVLRAKVRITDGTASWMVYGLAGPDAEAAARTRLRVPLDPAGLRQLVVAPRGEPLPEAEPADREGWRLEDIAAGLPEIVPATAGLFVAQMLNLDLLDAISLTKGCYTGQEVIARAHYRGQVKRRMQRFQAPGAAPAPGDRLTLPDGRAARVVSAAPDGTGGCEMLAVAAWPPSGARMSGDVEPAEPGTGTAVAATPLPLPYGPPPAG